MHQIATSELILGDRIPNFILPTAAGGMASFYDVFVGGPAVLFFAGFPGSKGPDELSAALRARFGPDTSIAIVFSSTREFPVPRAKDEKVLVMADEGGKLTAAHGGPGSALLADRNQQLVSRCNLGSELEDISAAPPLIDQPTVPAPILIVNRVLEPELCEEMIRRWRSRHEEGYVVSGDPRAEGRVVEASSKKRLDHFCDEETHALLKERVMRRVAPEAFKAFHFRTGDMQPFRIVAYQADRQDFFRPHRDNSSPRTQHRRFALSLNLNDDFEGGGVTFPEYNAQPYNTAAGSAVVFSCTLLHEALPVTRGTRFVALTFLYEEGFQKQPAESARRFEIPGLGR